MPTVQALVVENRTLQFYGRGFGSSDVTVTAVLDGVEVYNGTIPTLDQPMVGETPPPEGEQVLIFTVPNSPLVPTNFNGSLPMTITVTGGTGAKFGVINSNYQLPPAVGAGQPDVFDLCYYGNPTNSEGTPDPRSSVQIDGVLQVPPMAKSNGCWIWDVNSGSVFSYNFNISAGNVA